MERATTRRRRRLALGTLIGLAACAFGAGAGLGKGGAERPSVASTLPLRELAGERLLAGVSGTGMTPELRAAIRRGDLAGVILFADSFPTRAAGRRLIARLQGIRRPRRLRDPLLIMVDQEGGQVKRVSGAPTASAAQMGTRGAAFSRRQGRRTARNLRNVGVNVDLAPVLDVGRPGGAIAATERSFGATPRRVAAAAVPFAEALQAGGVAATGKHFPGLGAARLNTDYAVQRIRLSRQRLRAVDEAPYRRFIAAGGEMVMLSTAIYPAFSSRPAAFARPIATGELRGRLGFDGVSVTDALETASVRAFGGPARAGVAAVRAGTDLLLYTELDSAAAARRALVRKLRAGRLDRGEFEASAQRVLDLRARLGR
ncbi:MAG: glycoside hydrolase family 3 N-terminal domain-containing protein [Syntrophothermus sp.]